MAQRTQVPRNRDPRFVLTEEQFNSMERRGRAKLPEGWKPTQSIPIPDEPASDESQEDRA